MVSIVVPVHDDLTHLTEFIRSIERQDFPAIELIIIDDASERPLTALTSRIPARWITNPSNLGKAMSVNIGVSFSKGEILVISDPDVEPSPDLVSLWVRAFKRQSKLGVAGAYVYYRNERTRLTHAGALLRGPLHTIARRMVHSVDDGQSDTDFEVSNLVLDDIYAIRRSLWERLAGFDARNFDTMYEDADIQVRARKEGYSVAIVGGSRAFHDENPEGSSPLTRRWARRVLAGYKLETLTRNRLRFLRKHGLVNRGSLALQALLLVTYYGLLSFIVGPSLGALIARWSILARAVWAGMVSPLA